MSYVAVSGSVLEDSESAQFWQYCAAGEHVLFCSCESFVTQLRLRLSTRLCCRDVTLSKSASMRCVFLRKTRSGTAF